VGGVSRRSGDLRMNVRGDGGGCARDTACQTGDGYA
jgi:hypothetical protein